MFCKNCGAPVQDGDLFCSNCGTKVEFLPPHQPMPSRPKGQAAVTPSSVRPAPVRPVTPNNIASRPVTPPRAQQMRPGPPPVMPQVPRKKSAQRSKAELQELKKNLPPALSKSKQIAMTASGVIAVLGFILLRFMV